MNIQLLNDLAKIPTRGSAEAAGYDLYAATSYDITLFPHQTVKIGTGIAIELEPNTFGMLTPRSGIASKRGLRLANTPAVIDSDYRGEIIIALHNDSEEIQTVEAGERIAQMIIIPYIQIDEFNVVKNLSDTERGSQGFGSSGQF